MNAAINKKYDTEAGRVADLIYKHLDPELNHSLNKYNFGDPGNYIVSKACPTIKCSHGHDEEEEEDEWEEKVQEPSEAVALAEKIQASIKSQYELGQTADTLGRIGLMERQQYRSDVASAMLKKAVTYNV